MSLFPRPVGFEPGFTGATPIWVRDGLTHGEAERLADELGGRVQRPEFRAWDNGPYWAVILPYKED